MYFEVTPQVLPLNMENLEIARGKSNGSRHSVWGASKNTGNDLMGCNFSTLLRLFSLCTRFTPGWFVLMVNTHSPPFSLIQPCSNKNPNWYLRIEVKEGLPLANSGFLITSICKVTFAKIKTKITVEPLFRELPWDQGKCPLSGSWAGFC